MIEALLRATSENGYTGAVQPAEEASPALASIIHRVLKRDNRTCQCCGYQSQRFMEIQPLDGSDFFHPDNLVTLCHYCRALWHVPLAVANGAVFVLEPRLSQVEMIRFSRAYRWLPNWSAAIGDWEEDAVSKARKLLAASEINYGELAETIKMIWDNPSMPADRTIRKIMMETGIRLYFGQGYRPARIDALMAYTDRINVETNPYPKFQEQEEAANE